MAYRWGEAAQEIANACASEEAIFLEMYRRLDPEVRKSIFLTVKAMAVAEKPKLSLVSSRQFGLGSVIGNSLD